MWYDILLKSGFIAEQNVPSTLPHIPKLLHAILPYTRPSPCSTLTPLYPRISLILSTHLLRGRNTLFTSVNSLKYFIILLSFIFFKWSYHLLLYKYQPANILQSLLYRPSVSLLFSLTSLSHSTP